jgi:hypothetical protein
MAGEVTGETDENKAPVGGGDNRDWHSHGAGGAGVRRRSVGPGVPQGVKDQGIIIPDGEALSLAQSIYDLLSHGGGANQALSMVTKKTNRSVQQAADFGGLAVHAYCKNNIPGGK